MLSKISAIRFKMLANQIVKQIAAHDEDSQAKLTKLLGDARLGPDDIKAIVAALQFILCSAACYDVEGDVLTEELQQLGLPREHTEHTVRAYVDGRAAIQAHARERSLSLPRLGSLSWHLPEGADAVAFDMRIDEAAPADGRAAASQTRRLQMSADTFDLLHAELGRARAGMDGAPWEEG